MTSVAFDEVEVRYGERLEEYAAGDQDFLNWMHEGRRGGGVDLPR